MQGGITAQEVRRNLTIHLVKREFRKRDGFLVERAVPGGQFGSLGTLSRNTWRGHPVRGGVSMADDHEFTLDEIERAFDQAGGQCLCQTSERPSSRGRFFFRFFFRFLPRSVPYPFPNGIASRPRGESQRIRRDEGRPA